MPRGGTNRKMVVQIDYYTGEKIEEYVSIAEAAQDNFLAFSQLSKVLNKKGGKMPTKKLCFKFK